MTTEARAERLLWLDLETSGLDPTMCSIIEVAWAITLLEVGPLGEVQAELVQPGKWWEDGAREMHTASGLAALAERCGHSLGHVELRILRALDAGVDYYLAGSSIHFDRGFIRRHMPALDARLHYRMLDVSAVVLARRAQGWQSPPSPDPKPHRAEADLRASHALLRAAMEPTT